MLALALPALAAVPTDAAAQRVSVGLTAGGGLATFSTQDPEDRTEWRGAWSAGLYTGIALTDRFSLQPEVVYARKGARDEVVLESIDQTIQRDYAAHYVEFPVLLRFSPRLDGPVSPYILAGPAPAYLLQATNTAGDATPEDITDQLARFDMGAVIALGLAYPFGFGTAELAARGGFSVTDIDRSGAPAPLGVAEVNRNRAVVVTAGFGIPLPWF
ncbi:MAG: porin family protein [Gemmatimonadota bacterium]